VPREDAVMFSPNQLEGTGNFSSNEDFYEKSAEAIASGYDSDGAHSPLNGDLRQAIPGSAEIEGGHINYVKPSSKVQTASHFHSRQHSKTNSPPRYQIREEGFQSPPKIIRPVAVRESEEVEANRVVLYREDLREVPVLEGCKGRSHYCLVEISRSKHKLYIIVIKRQIPLSGRGKFQRIRKDVPQVIDMTEKQGKKLLLECENDYTRLVDRLRLRQGRVQVKDFDVLLKFGNPEAKVAQQSFVPSPPRQRHVTLDAIY